MCPKVAIVGAGLSGLACAVELKKVGIDVEIFEACAEPGGRIKTDEKDGFLLDHGFQVFLPSYELGPVFFDYEELNLKAFDPGALIFKNGQFYRMTDPLRDPRHARDTLFNPLATFKDKLLTLKLKLESRQGRTNFTHSLPTPQFLKEFGFSDGFIESFFKPFFSGVFLQKDIDMPHWYFLYLFNRFSKAKACVPQNGMKALIDQLTQKIGLEHIRINHPIQKVTAHSIMDQDKKFLEFEQTILATDQQEKSKMLGIKNNNNFYPVTTHYYKTRSKKWASKTLYLNADRAGPINHIACMSATSSSYAPEGWHLFSVNVLSEEINIQDESLEVRDHLKHLFKDKEIENWEWIKSYSIKQALPSEPAYGTITNLTKEGIILCGDYLESPSIQGALSSGVRAAKLCAKRIKIR